MSKTIISFFLLAAIASTPAFAGDTTRLTGEMSKFAFSTGDEVGISSASVADADDNTVSLGQFHGKVVVLNLWATWCGPCVNELPTLDRLQAAVDPSDIVVVPVSIDRGGAKQARPYLNRMNIANMQPLFDRVNGLGRMMSVSRIPLTIIIGRDGSVVGQLVGTAQWDSPEAVALVKSIAGKSGSAPRNAVAGNDVRAYLAR